MSHWTTFAIVFAALTTAACGGSEPATGNGSDGGGGGSGSGGSSSGGSSSGGSSSGGGTLPPVTDAGALDAGGGVPLPPNVVKTEIGGYALGAAISGDGADAGAASTNGANNCSFIMGVVRDFKGNDESGGHPDFEHYRGEGVTPNLVESALGADSKPVYGGICDVSGRTSACPYDQQLTSKTDFDQWYRYTPNVNKPYLLYLVFAPNAGVMTFESLFYFPLDRAGWGDSGTGNDNARHNFGFTSEIHTEFQYNGGEAFTFRGDDDVWVFMNHRLAMDLGGLHPTESNTINLDQQASALGLQKGTVYPLDLFHAERHTEASRFRIDTNLAFTNCGSVPPDGPR